MEPFINILPVASVGIYNASSANLPNHLTLVAKHLRPHWDYNKCFVFVPLIVFSIFTNIPDRLFSSHTYHRGPRMIVWNLLLKPRKELLRSPLTPFVVSHVLIWAWWGRLTVLPIHLRGFSRTRPRHDSMSWVPLKQYGLFCSSTWDFPGNYTLLIGN